MTPKKKSTPEEAVLNGDFRVALGDFKLHATTTSSTSARKSGGRTPTESVKAQLPTWVKSKKGLYYIRNLIEALLKSSNLKEVKSGFDDTLELMSQNEEAVEEMHVKLWEVYHGCEKLALAVVSPLDEQHQEVVGKANAALKDAEEREALWRELSKALDAQDKAAAKEIQAQMAKLGIKF